MFRIVTKTDEYMSIVVTHVCDRACPFCIDAYRGNNEYIRLQDVAHALKIASQSGVKDILLVGGEPTLHPAIQEIARLVKLFGFNLILTTNYSKPDVICQLDQYVDSFNISFYNQPKLPSQKDFAADLTLSSLLFQGQLDTKEKLDGFIDKYSTDYILKFSTLTVCNEWTRLHSRVDYLDSLPGETIILFGEIEGKIYRGHIIKRYDRVLFHDAKQSLKCHVDGQITHSWIREGIESRVQDGIVKPSDSEVKL